MSRHRALAALDQRGGGLCGALAPDQQAAEHHHAQQQAEDEPDQLDPDTAEIAGVQGTHGFGDELQGGTVAEQAGGFDLAGIRVQRGRLEHERIPAASGHEHRAVGVAGQEHRAGLQAGDTPGDEPHRLVQLDVWNLLTGCGAGHVGACDDRRDAVVGQGDVVVGKDGLDQEPGAGDGNQGDEPDRPDAAQAMEVAPEDPGAC